MVRDILFIGDELYTLHMLLDLFFPKTCLSCNAFGSYVCLVCQRKLVGIVVDLCIYCKKRTIQGETHAACKKYTAVDGVMSLLKYQQETKRMIKKLKYRLLFDAFHEFFQVVTPFALDKIPTFKKNHLEFFLQPVPLHSARLKWRGFNQAQYIAEFFHILCDYPIVNVLKRVKNTLPQASMDSKQARQTNIKEAFTLEKGANVRGKNFILVDDVFTTGNTVQEAARILKNEGAAKVYVFTIARAI